MKFTPKSFSKCPETPQTYKEVEEQPFLSTACTENTPVGLSSLRIHGMSSSRRSSIKVSMWILQIACHLEITVFWYFDKRSRRLSIGRNAAEKKSLKLTGCLLLFLTVSRRRRYKTFSVFMVVRRIIELYIRQIRGIMVEQKESTVIDIPCSTATVTTTNTTTTTSSSNNNTRTFHCGRIPFFVILISIIEVRKNYKTKP